VSLTLAVQCLLIVAASLAGGMLPEWVRLTHRRLQLVMSFVGGLMLGIALLHLLPHAAHQLGSIEEAARAMLVGLLVMFLLLRMFHFHEHEPLHPPHAETIACGHDHDAGHDAAAEQHVAAAPLTAHRLSWGGVAFGLSVHTLIDGMALAAAVQADQSRPGRFAALAGWSVFFAIVFHKPLDAVSITSLMTAGGWSRGARLLVNTAFAAMCPLGAVLFAVGIDAAPFAAVRGALLGAALAFSAGVFVCISMSDLLPEIEFHTHDRMGLSVSLAAGILVAVLLSVASAG
jgi:zinc and cadmium transporter